MRHILFYILLTVTDISAKNEEKRLEDAIEELSEKEYEEEAKRDIENLLHNIKVGSNEDNIKLELSNERIQPLKNKSHELLKQIFMNGSVKNQYQTSKKNVLMNNLVQKRTTKNRLITAKDFEYESYIGNQFENLLKVLEFKLNKILHRLLRSDKHKDKHVRINIINLTPSSGKHMRNGYTIYSDGNDRLTKQRDETSDLKEVYTFIDKFDSNHKDDTFTDENSSEKFTVGTPDNEAEQQEQYERRKKRASFTQAGYTQDPDTCKTYNENLVILWANLSKYINVTEQPNERALHNIAMMIQAYLDHQNIKSPTELYKVKQADSRDGISNIILRIRKMLRNSRGSSEKITKIITKYLKPFYGDVENTDCQTVNEESLSSSIELLYKNYVHDAECRDDDDEVDRNKELNLRKRTTKDVKITSGNLPSTSNDYKPRTIITDDELYKDFLAGKIHMEQPNNKFRRIYKQGRKQNSLSLLNKSRDQVMNGDEKIKIRSRSLGKSSNKIKTKGYLHSDSGKGKCEKFALRKLTVLLRPVIERFMALLECQLDNTVRSTRYDKDSMDQYYLFASKFNSNDETLNQDLPHNKTHKNTKTGTNISKRKLQLINPFHRDISDELDKGKGIIMHKNKQYYYSYNKPLKIGKKSISSESTNFQNFKVPDKNGNNYVTTYNEYLISSPLYDNYDSINYKDNSYSSSSLISPITDKDNTKDRGKLIDNNAILPVKEQTKDILRDNGYQYNARNFPEKFINLFNINSEQNYEDSTILSNNEKLSDVSKLTQSQNTVSSFVSITDFLKKARDDSLQTPEFAIPFAIDSSKGYVELTYLVKYPKMIVYRPQFLVKNTMPYDDFLKTNNSFYMTNDEVRLMKIVRHLPDNTVKVLFETEEFETPLEIRNMENNRRSGSVITEVNPLENRIDTLPNNNKYTSSSYSLLDSDSSKIYETHNYSEETHIQSERSDSGENDSYLD